MVPIWHKPIKVKGFVSASKKNGHITYIEIIVDVNWYYIDKMEQAMATLL